MTRSSAACGGSIVASLCLLLLLQTRTGGTAPAQHLAISVEGNTPTLIVTSAEIGITPKILAATAATTTAITPTDRDGDQALGGRVAAAKERDGKNAAAKLKSKSNKLQYSKKRLQYAAKEKALAWGESATTTKPTTTTTTTTSTTTAQTTAAVQVTVRTADRLIAEQRLPTTTTRIAVTMANARAATIAATTAGHKKSAINEKKQAAKSIKATPTNKPATTTTTTTTTTDALATTTSSAASPASTAATAVDASTSNQYETTRNDAAMVVTPLANAAGRLTAAEKPTTATATVVASKPAVKQPENGKPDAAMATAVGMLPHEVPATAATLAPGARQRAILTQTSVAASDAEAADDAAITTLAKEEVSALPTAISAKPEHMETATVAATMAKIPTTAEMITTITATTTTTTKITQTTSSPAASELAAATSNAPVITTDVEAVPKEITTTTTTTTSADIENPVAYLPTSKHGDYKVASQQTTMVMPTTKTTTTTAPATDALASATDEVNATNKSTIEATTLSNSQPTAAFDDTVNGDGGKSATAATPTPTITITTVKTQPLTAAKRRTSEKLSATTTPVPATTDNGGIVFIDAVQADEPQRPPPPPTQRQHADAAADGILKLIDLERHDSKSIEGVQRRHPHNDSGHDGVKRTRKKQLTDKHFLLLDAVDMANDSTATIVDSTTSTTTAATTTTTTTAITKETKTQKTVNGDVAGVGSRNPNAGNAVTTTTTTTMPSLVPVHNGYLGPIFMEEKTFSVVHAHRKPQPHHETSIESQLRDGRIVEIIAPTALLEQITTTAAATTTTTTTAAPTPASSQLLAETTTTKPITNTTTTSSALPLSHPDRIQHTPVLSTTVFQVPETLSSTTRLPVSAPKRRNDVVYDVPHQQQHKQQSIKSTTSLKLPSSIRTESKISDIQIEVYDSTVDSIVASTNFKDTDGYFAPPLESAVGTTRPPAHTQERFTQYVVDRTDLSTQESSVAPLTIISGKPEPAAIEIHINVSEGVGNESEDLEFSYRQPDYFGNAQPRSEFAAKAATSLSLKPFVSGAITRNDSNAASNERSDEILVVEIIDTGDNSTENSVSAENINPIFTFRSDSEAEVELKDIKYYPPEAPVKSSQMSDELFLADLKKADENLPKPPPPPPPPPRKPIVDRDSDTIFYISNTEVKVGESLPTANTNFEQQQQQLRKSRLENQFFPANYMASTHPNAARLDDAMPQQHRYEEDIILSPLRNTADALKIFRSQGDGAPPLDVTYVGESVMEVEQSSGAGIMATTMPLVAASQMPDVIIQPAILPEMSIGVPVIGELPPQIELKEIDFMPDEANQLRSGVYENNIDDGNGNGNGNGGDVDRLVESSVQYGGDLIDESAGGAGFDGIEGSYPFGNPVVMRGSARHAADYAHYSVNRGVSNLRKDELSADVASSGEIVVALAAGNTEQNGTLKELLANKSGNETAAAAAALPMSMNTSYAERMSNATAYSVMEDRNGTAEGNYGFMNLYTLIIGLFIVLLPVVLTVSMACALRYLYIKYQPSAGGNNNDSSNAANQANGTGSVDKAEGGATQDGSAQAPQYQTTKGAHDKDSITHNPNTIGDKSAKPSNSNAKSAASTLHIVGEKSAAASLSASASASSFQAKEPTQTLMSAPSSANTSSTQTESDHSNNSVQGNYARPNGSVTKMTLKNNHLIVETEERHDISRDARETKMHYNTSDKDGVFVVEVARGVDSKTIPDSPVADGSEQRLPVYAATPTDANATTLRTEDEKVLKQHEEVQIHQPPATLPKSGTNEELQRSLHQIVEVEEPPTFSPNASARAEINLVHSSNTGLSQSDLSSSSSTDSNKRYSYGNQELYTVEQTGYATTSPTAQPTLAATENGIGDDDDRKSENGDSLEHSPTQSAGPAASEQSCNKLSTDRQNKQVKPSNVNVCQSNGSDVEPADKAAKKKATAEEVEAVRETAALTSPKVEEVEAVRETAALTSPTVEEVEAVRETAALTSPTAEAVVNVTDEIVTIDKVHAATTTVTATAEREAPENGDLSSADTVNGDSEPPPTTQTKTPTPTPPEECNAYDSIMSLPDPPSTEEITQLYDYSITDTNQFDSLPPPPPPPPLDVNDNTETALSEAADPKLEQQQQLHTGETPPTSALTNGNNNANTVINGNGNGNVDDPEPAVQNGHVELSRIAAKLPPTLEVTGSDGIVSNGKMSPAPLTPPASPPAHFSNGLNGVSGMNGVNGVRMPVAVDVNGS